MNDCIFCKINSGEIPSPKLYEDDDMFWGHVVTVNGTLKKGPVDADIQG